MVTVGQLVYTLLAAFVCESAGQLTTGSEVVFNTGSTYYVSSAGCIDCYSTNGVTCYQDIGDSSKGKCVVVSQTSGVLSYGAILTLNSVATLNYVSVAVLSETYATVCYKNDADSGAGTCHVL